MTQEALNAERRARLALEQRVGELQSRVRGMWMFPATVASATSYRQIMVGSGNLLITIDGVGYYGVKSTAGTLATVPTVSPTAINTVYADGLSAAYDLGLNPAATTGTLVWITAATNVTTKDPAGGADITVANTIAYNMVYGSVGLSARSYQVPVSGSPGTYATVYGMTVVAV